MSEKRCYSINDIQEILGICKTTAYNLIKENQFRTVLIGGKYRISRKSFDAWLDGEMAEAEPEQDRNDSEQRENPEKQEEKSAQERQQDSQTRIDELLAKYGYMRR